VPHWTEGNGLAVLLHSLNGITHPIQFVAPLLDTLHLLTDRCLTERLSRNGDTLHVINKRGGGKSAYVSGLGTWIVDTA